MGIDALDVLREYRRELEQAEKAFNAVIAKAPSGVEVKVNVDEFHIMTGQQTRISTKVSYLL